MSDFNEIVGYLQNRRQRAVDGKYNCIPLPFQRFKQIWPGIEMGKYIIITAAQKIGKTKFTDFLFVYNLIDFLIKHPEMHVKILYFSLEDTARKKYVDYLCHLLMRLDTLEVSSTQLESIDNEHPIKPEILDLIQSEKYQKYIRKYEDVVHYVDTVKNPTGINKECREYALANGHLNFKEMEMKNPDTGIMEKRKVIDPLNPYTPNDPEEYRIVILDNAANLSNENGLSKRETIEKMSKYAVTLRDQLNYIFVLVQHQAQDLESNEAFKLDRMKPRTDSLADCKTTSRDCNMIIGLYSPFKFQKTSYEGYDITKLRNNVRFMEILDDRNYGANGNICPLMFEGASTYFRELPLPNDPKMKQVYDYLDRVRPKVTLLSYCRKLFYKLKLIQK